MVTVLGHRGMLGSVVARRWAELGATGDYIVNCTSPDDLGLIRALAHGNLIQPSSDAIAEDTHYAWVKRVIEQVPCVIIRAGITDLRKRPAVAYTNWLCNPLTPLEWADFAWSQRDAEYGVHAIGREPLSRYEVEAALAVVFDYEPPRAAEAAEPLDRLQPVADLPPLREALIEYRRWLG